MLREPFCAFTVVDVAWFLRLAYCLDEAQAERDLQQMGSCLSAVLRLAHALDAPRLLKKVERHIAGGLGGWQFVVSCRASQMLPAGEPRWRGPQRLA